MIIPFARVSGNQYVRGQALGYMQLFIILLLSLVCCEMFILVSKWPEKVYNILMKSFSNRTIDFSTIRDRI